VDAEGRRARQRRGESAPSAAAPAAAQPAAAPEAAREARALPCGIEERGDASSGAACEATEAATGPSEPADGPASGASPTIGEQPSGARCPTT